MDQFEEQEYTKGFDFSLWKKLLKYFTAYRKDLAILIVTMILTAVCDTLFPMINKFAIDNYIVPQNLDGFRWIVIAFIALTIMQFINVAYFISKGGKFEVTIVYELRKLGFKKLQELSFSYYDKTPVGWMMARMTSDVQRIGDTLVWGTIDMVYGVAYVIAISIIMLIFNWKLALITLAVVPLIAVLSIYFQKKILKGHREARKINSKITASFNEGINGAKTTKTLVREDKNSQEFSELAGSMYKASVRVSMISAVYLPVVTTIGSLGVAFALSFGGIDVTGGVISLGMLSAFLAYAIQVFDPIYQIARVVSEYNAAQASAERTMTLLDTEPEIHDSPEVIEKYGTSFAPKEENWEKIDGHIRFKNVSFQYVEGTKILDDFSLDVKFGEKIALVGETGAGKSTIVNLICRFYEPTEGQIFIDDVDYKERSQIWLHSNLGYVLQTPHLFSGTVRDNIRYAKLDATDEEIIAAAKLVHADTFISKMEKGYDTEVGESGGKLSTGEKQLISFARAIIANPRIFILDEATSSIDTETEQIIQSAVDAVLEGRTSFIVAHRLSTIRSADRILVIRDGKITEQGNHKQLLALRGYYYNLYTNQFKEEAEARILGVEK